MPVEHVPKVLKDNTTGEQSDKSRCRARFDNASTWEVEEGRLRIQNQSQLHNKLKMSLSEMKPCLKIWGEMAREMAPWIETLAMLL